MTDQEEARILAALDLAVGAAPARARIEAIVARAGRRLRESPGEPLAWEPVPLDVYTSPLPEAIRSSWVFVVRGGTATGAERHPNSHQRMMSYRGSGDFQTRAGGDWRSHLLTSDPAAPIEGRWISIPPGVWHKGVVPGADWVVVSFHTATQLELVEERPAAEAGGPVRRRRYAGQGRARPGPASRGEGREP